MPINTCPVCGSAMRPLAGLSSYCPNDCDRIWKSYYPNALWEWALITDMKFMPKDAERAWLIGSKEEVQELLTETTPTNDVGWEINDGSRHSLRVPVVVFKTVK